MPSLAQLYRRLLLAYPEEYRRAREAEMLATLLDVSAPGQTLPSIREAVGLIVGGLRTRARLSAPVGRSVILAETLRLGAALAMAMYMADTIILSVYPGPGFLRGRLLPLALAATVVALLRRPRRPVGLALIALDVFLAWPLQATSVLVFHTTVGVIVSWFAVAPIPLALAALTFVWYPSARPGSRPWPSSAIALVVLLPAALQFGTYLGYYFHLEALLHVHIPISLFTLVAPAAALAGVSLLMRNPAPALAASIYLATFLGTMVFFLWFTSYYEAVIWLATGLIVACLGAAALSRRTLARA